MTPTYVAILERLIGFPTVSSASNLDLIGWVRGYLEDHGACVRTTHDDGGGKANLFATLGAGPGGLVLSGHTDVVPTQGQAWTDDPFTAVVRDGRVYGRGACDMKGFIAVALSLVPTLGSRAGAEPVHFALSYDEEVGCLGARRLIADIAASGASPRACIVGEPTGMRVVVGHKGAGMYAFGVRGRAAHSSLAPFGVNAVEQAVRIIARLQAIAARLRDGERRHDGFDVPYSTVQVNRIAGGGAGNIVADQCDFLVDIRSLPWTSQEVLLAEVTGFIEAELLPAMRAVAPEADVTVRQVGDVPAFAIDPAEPIVRDGIAHSPHRDCGHVAFGSEAGLFQQAGIPTIICGPGSIDQAHRPDEFVALDQLARCEAMLKGLIAHRPRPDQPGVAS